MFQKDREVVATYVRETKERLKTIEDGVRVLERQPEKVGTELVHEIFRATHSIKAGANLLQYTPIEDLAHLMESILLGYRTGELTPSLASTAPLQDGVDAIRVLIENLNQRDSFNIAPELRRLARVLDPGAA